MHSLLAITHRATQAIAAGYDHSARLDQAAQAAARVLAAQAEHASPAELTQLRARRDALRTPLASQRYDDNQNGI